MRLVTGTGCSPPAGPSYGRLRKFLRAAFLVPSLVFLALPCFPRLYAQTYGERDTGFSLVLSRRTEQPSGILASLSSTASYPCVGYGIRSTVVWTGDTATIAVTGLRVPSPCVGGAELATGTAFLGACPDTIMLKIDYRGEADLYRIVSTGGRAGAYPVRMQFTRVRFEAPPR